MVESWILDAMTSIRGVLGFLAEAGQALVYRRGPPEWVSSDTSGVHRLQSGSGASDSGCRRQEGRAERNAKSGPAKRRAKAPQF